MTPVNKHDAILPLHVIAFADDGAALAETLAETLAQCPAGTYPVTVLGSDSDELRACAADAGVDFIPGLPQVCAESRYWCTVRKALPDNTGPCLIVRAGTALPGYWASRFGRAWKPGTAAVFPLSVRHPCTTAFDDCRRQPGLDVHAVDRWLNRYAPGRDYDVPLLCGWTALVDPARLPTCCDDDMALVEAARRAGALLVATDNLYVDDSTFPPQTLPDSLYPGWRDAIELRHHLTGARHAITELSQRGEQPPPELPPVKPVRLHLCHGWGGGLWRWVEDFIDADTRCHNLVLKPIGDRTAFCQTLALYEGAGQTPVASWTLAEPILSTAIAHREYAQLLGDIIESRGVNEILVSSLIGHSLDVFDAAAAVTVVCHDFYPLCPPILATWGSPCTTCDDGRLRACLAENPGHRFFEFEPYPHWQALRAAWVAAVAGQAVTLVVPSQSVAERLQSLAPPLREKMFHVVAHGLPGPLLASLAPDKHRIRGERRRLRILVLGSLEHHKGGNLLHAALPRLTAFADLVLLGVGDAGKQFAGMEAVEIIPGYDRDQLGASLERQAPDLGLLLSTVPETFSYTLSELHGAGIPVAATALGAFADRIEPDRDGWLFEPNAQALVSLLETLGRQPERIDQARANLAQRQPRDTAAMVADYDRLFAGRVAEVRRPVVAASARGDAAFYGPVYIRPEASFREAVRGFARYTAAKVRSTRKIPRYGKRLLVALLNTFAR